MFPHSRHSHHRFRQQVTCSTRVVHGRGIEGREKKQKLEQNGTWNMEHDEGGGGEVEQVFPLIAVGGKRASHCSKMIER